MGLTCECVCLLRVYVGMYWLHVWLACALPTPCASATVAGCWKRASLVACSLPRFQNFRILAPVGIYEMITSCTNHAFMHNFTAE